MIIKSNSVRKSGGFRCSTKAKKQANDLYHLFIYLRRSCSVMAACARNKQQTRQEKVTLLPNILFSVFRIAPHSQFTSVSGSSEGKEK